MYGVVGDARHMNLLILAATGNVGGQIITQLRGTGHAVRAVTRDPHAAGFPTGVEVMLGDLSAPETIAACLDGIDAVFLLWPLHTGKQLPAVLEVVARQTRRGPRQIAQRERLLGHAESVL